MALELGLLLGFVFELVIDFRLTLLSTRASRLVLEFCLRSRDSGAFFVAGCLPCLVIVLRVLANLDFTSSLRSTILILLAQSMQASTRP